MPSQMKEQKLWQYPVKSKIMRQPTHRNKGEDKGHGQLISYQQLIKARKLT